MNPPLNLQPTNTPPCDSGSSSGLTPLNNNSQKSNEGITFKQVLCHWFGKGTNVHHDTTTSLFQMWFVQNVYPNVTPKRILCFCLSQVSFFLAYGFFTQTELYKKIICSGEGHDQEEHNHQNVLCLTHPLFFLMVVFGVHTICLNFLMFFNFCFVTFENYRHNHILKSLGEFLVMLLVPLLINAIENEEVPQIASSTSNYSKVATLVMCALLTVDAFSIISLLHPGHHYALLEATTTLTMHLGLVTKISIRVSTSVFVFVVLVMKNFVWKKNVDRAQDPTNESHPVAWVAPEVV